MLAKRERRHSGFRTYFYAYIGPSVRMCPCVCSCVCVCVLLKGEFGMPWSIPDIIMEQRLKWLGHVGRMDMRNDF